VKIDDRRYSQHKVEVHLKPMVIWTVETKPTSLLTDSARRAGELHWPLDRWAHPADVGGVARQGPPLPSFIALDLDADSELPFAAELGRTSWFVVNCGDDGRIPFCQYISDFRVVNRICV